MRTKIKITFHGDKEHGTITVQGIVEKNYGKGHDAPVDVRMSDDGLRDLALALGYWHMHTTVGGWGYGQQTVKVGTRERMIRDFITPGIPGGVSAQPAVLFDWLTRNCRAFTFNYNGEEVR